MSAPSDPPVSMTKRWLLASRPKTLPAAVSPVLVGWTCALWALYARGKTLADFHLPAALAALLVAVCIQIAANLINDVSDFQKGADSGERLGPLRVTQAGLISPRQMWSGAVLMLVLAGAAGLYIVFTTSSVLETAPVLILGAACLAGALFYSVGKHSMSATGLGDLFAVLFFGFAAVCGTVFVLSGAIPPLAWACALPVGLLVADILVVNNIRDIESDRLAGRMNIPVRYGRKAGELEYALLLAGAYLSAFWAAGAAGSAWPLLTWLSLPLAISLFRRLRAAPTGPVFNIFLAHTARLTLIYSLLLAMGILLSIKL
jgi:1,4-dihydroxy-2-naphthoate octaprenyltransferase